MLCLPGDLHALDCPYKCVAPACVLTISACSDTLAGKGLDNPKGEYNCFLNVIIQSLWQLEGFRDTLTEMAELRKHSESGRDNLALLKSLAHVFQLLSGAPIKTPPSPAPASEGSAGAGAWGKASPGGGGGAWGAGGMGGRNLFVVDPAQCRAALSSIFSEQGRSQVCVARVPTAARAGTTRVLSTVTWRDFVASLV